MKISPAAELAVRGILVLAERYGKGPVTLTEICTDRELPKQYLTKIFAMLAKEGVITPIRGKHGGYVLAREPGATTLLQVIEAVEGPLALNYCQHSPSRCSQADCAIRPIWTEVQDFVRGKLNVSLAQCLSSGLEGT